MNKIIKDKIKDALRWVCLYAPADLLGGTDEPDTEEEGEPVHHATGIMVDVDLMNPAPEETQGTETEGESEESEETETESHITPIEGQTAGVFDLDANFIKLARVRVDGWHRAVRVPITEDSDEYLQLYDANGATATYDRPQAALIEKSVRQIEVWPWENSKAVHYTYISSNVPDEPFDVVSGDDPPVHTLHYALPPRARTSFIYYLAYLLCSAYGDPRADRMLDIAKQNLGK